MIRRCHPDEFDAVLEVINDGASAYRGVIPDDRWHEPYMPRDELRSEIEAGVRFWGSYDPGGELLGVMGIQDVEDVTLIRHAYVRTRSRRGGIGSALLSRLKEEATGPLLIGTWAAAEWAVRFYVKHGFRVVDPETKNRLLRRYWSVPERQIETSVVLADERWFRAAREVPCRYRDVDRAPDPGALVGYVDRVARMETFRAYKERSFDLLGIAEGSRILDVGCGSGHDIAALAERVGPSGLVAGVDSSRAMIDEARTRLESLAGRVDLRCADAYELPFDADTFDACRVDRVLQHLEDPGAAIRELVRVARPGARVVASEPDWGTLVVTASDRRATRAVAAAGSDSIPNGWVGRFLGPLFREAGLLDVALSFDGLVTTRFPEAEDMFQLRTFVEWAQRRGALSREEGANWLEDCERADEGGRFFASLTIFTARGHKPGERVGEEA